MGGVDGRAYGRVIMRANPLALKHTPKRLCNIQMQRVWRQIEEEEYQALPYGSHLLYGAAPVDTIVVEHIPYSVSHLENIGEFYKLK